MVNGCAHCSCWSTFTLHLYNADMQKEKTGCSSTTSMGSSTCHGRCECDYGHWMVGVSLYYPEALMTRERLLFPAPLWFQDSRYEPRKWLFLFGSFWTATRSCSDTEVTSSAKKLCLFCCEIVQFSLLSATQCASGGSSHQGSSRATRLSSAPCET